jgi:hypothetical protein
MTMFSWISRWLGRKAPAMATRLSKDEVLAIARKAAAADSLGQYLAWATPYEQAGKRIWSVTSSTRGAQLVVLIDDESATVLEIKHVGRR